MKHAFFAMAICLVVGAAIAGPSISIKRVQQRYPWNGMVDIDYEISYETGTDPNDYQVCLSLADKKLASFLSFAACDLPTKAGVNRVTWDAVADGMEGLVKGAQVKASLLFEQLTPETAAYAIIDVSGGRNASTYPVRYLGDSTIASSVFNRELYKTTRIVLKKVPAGEFWMGVGSTSRNATFGNVADRDGVSRHRVKLTEDFLLGVFPVTIAQYTNVVAAPLLTTQDVPTTPMTRLWWYSTEDLAQLEFFSALAAKTRCRGAAVAGFGLPTESQWEYACRAGTSTTYYNGQNYDAQEQYKTSGFAFREMMRANFATKFSISKAAADWPDEVPSGGLRSAMGFWATGQYPPNPWGFYDMIGNGYEWCSDWHADYPAGTEVSPAVNPKGPDTCPTGAGRSFRSCAIDDSAWNCIGCGVRSPESNKVATNSQRHGFRLALAVPESK